VREVLLVQGVLWDPVVKKGSLGLKAAKEKLAQQEM